MIPHRAMLPPCSRGHAGPSPRRQLPRPLSAAWERHLANSDQRNPGHRRLPAPGEQPDLQARGYYQTRRSPADHQRMQYATITQSGHHADRSTAAGKVEQRYPSMARRLPAWTGRQRPRATGATRELTAARTGGLGLEPGLGATITRRIAARQDKARRDRCLLAQQRQPSARAIPRQAATPGDTGAMARRRLTQPDQAGPSKPDRIRSTPCRGDGEQPQRMQPRHQQGHGRRAVDQQEPQQGWDEFEQRNAVGPETSSRRLYPVSAARRNNPDSRALPAAASR